MERCSVVWDDDVNCAIIDPGFYTAGERDTLYGFIENKGLCVKAILLTHGHFDHIFGVAEASAHFNVPVYMHPADKVIIDEANPKLCSAFGLKVPAALAQDIIPSEEGDIIKVGSMKFEVIETPGHTPGGVCYLEREQKIIAMRFFGNMTQSQIASEIGISQMHVSRLLAHALQVLRSGLSPSA